MNKLNEWDVLEKYIPYLSKVVGVFQAKCGGGAWRLSREDLLQEVQIAFLQHIRTHDEAEYGRCFLTIWHAMYEAVRRDYPLSISYHAFSKQRRGPLYITDDMRQIKDERDELEAIETECALAQFMDGMDEMAQTIIKGKLEGKTGRAIAQENGWSDVQVSRALHRMRSKWDVFRYQI